MKKCFIPVICLLLCTAAFASERTSSFSIEAGAGLAIRNIDEYIYSAYDDYAVSLLEYKAYLAQGNLGIKYTEHNMGIGANINSVLPLKCGTFNDYDFTESGFTKNLCFFDNYCTGSVGINLSVDYSFSINSWFGLRPCFELEYDYDTFIGKNGWGYFGTSEYSKNGQDVPWDSEFARKAKRVSAISFRTNNFYFFTGLFFCMDFSGVCTVELGTFVAPVCSTLSYDYHYDETGAGWDYELTEMQTSSFMNFKECLNVQVRLKESLYLTFNASWTFRPTVKGTIEDSYQPSGNRLSFCHFGLGIKKTL